jgi:hypothetical protein
MSTTMWQRPGFRTLVATAALAALLSAGCTTAFSSPEDVRVVASGDGVYLLARSTAVARSVCIASGFDAARAEGRRFAEGRAFAPGDRGAGGTQGCYMAVRDLIVCQEGDNRCLGREER